MSRTVDLVVIGEHAAALGEAVDGLRLGRRVLVVLRSGDARAARRFRREVQRAANREDSALTVIPNAEVVRVDGIDRVEAVVIRHTQTGRLRAVNASAVVATTCSASAPLTTEIRPPSGPRRSGSART